MLFLEGLKGLGRKESKKAPDESEETQGIRLEKVE
jgi:hypothetical protein